MSIKIMTRVWDLSEHKGTARLLLLALADHASDDGVAWPGIPRLAHKTKVTERQVKRLLRTLEQSGELYTNVQGGRGNANLYLITLGFSEDEIRKTLVQRFEFELEEASTIAQEIAKKGDTHVTFSESEKVTSRAEKVTPASPEPSRIIKNHDGDDDISTSNQPSVKILTDWGISQTVAEDLVGDLTPTDLEVAISIAERKSDPQRGNPQGYLVNMLRNGWKPKRDKTEGEKRTERYARYTGGKYGHLVKH